MDGVIAFCIKPEIQRGNSDGYTVSNFSHDVRETFPALSTMVTKTQPKLERTIW